jgi:predicted ester cyclase
MTVEITLKLPDSLVEQAQRLGLLTHRNAETVLADALEAVWMTFENLPDSNLYTPVSELSDEAVSVLAKVRMDEAQSQRLGELQAQGKTVGLSELERYELLALLQISQLGQLRKSEALAEAVQRGLREPLSA